MVFLRDPDIPIMKAKWLQMLPVFTSYLGGKIKHVFGSSNGKGGCHSFSYGTKLDQLLIPEPITMSMWIEYIDWLMPIKDYPWSCILVHQKRASTYIRKAKGFLDLSLVALGRIYHLAILAAGQPG